MPFFERTFLRLNYIDITKNTYIQSSTVMDKMAREALKNWSCYTFIDYQIILKQR
jgi:hypothetical protein